MRKRTEKEIKETIENLGYTYINSYLKSARQRRVIIQDKHGYKYDVDSKSVLRGQGIRFVDKSNLFSLENISLWLKINNSQFRLLESNEYAESGSRLNLYCNICKDYLGMSWENLLNGKRCGVCRGLQVGKHHNLAVQRPDIAKEWHPTLNGDLNPTDVTYASGKKAWWRCPNGHSYFSSIANRTNKGNGCKECYDKQKESKVATKLKEYVFSKYEAEEEYLIFKNSETNRWLPYDIYIFGGENKIVNGIYIEIHGQHHYIFNSFWHKDKEEFKYQKHKDRLKRRFARKHGAYIEVDLRKIKTTEQAIEFIESILKTLL